MDSINAIIAWIKGVFLDLMEFLSDLPLLVLDSFLKGLSTLFGAIEVPDFLSDGLQPLFNKLPDSVAFLLGESGFVAALLLFGAGVAFRLVRKVLTLFQW